MAKFYPENYKEYISLELKEKVLKKLEYLSNDYEIFINIFSNNKKSDITILRKWYWVLIFNFYKNNDNLDNTFLKIKNIYNNLFDLVKWLLELKIKENFKNNLKNILEIINYWIYFLEEKELKEEFKYCKIINYNNIDEFLPKIKNIKFNDKLYYEFKNFLYKNIEKNLEKIDYNEQQKKLIFLKEKKNQKINWFPWSWKTVILAWRVKNSLERDWWKALILTYNITLRKYIEDNIIKIWWDLNKIEINHYHWFIYNYLANEWKFNYKKFLYDCWIINNFKENKNKYDIILIDEVQDFKKEWIEIIKKCFLKDKWEIVFFWDSKQNIYKRDMDNDKNPYTWISGAWNKLTTSYRFENKKITNISNEFQKYFFKNKYEIEEIPIQNSFDFIESYFEYFYIKEENYLDQIIKIISDIKEKLKINNNFCILWPEKEKLREIDYYYREKFKLKTTTTFETKEIFNIIKNNKLDVEKIEKNKKYNFNNNSKLTKISTIQSFKWLETDNVFLIIEKDNQNLKDIQTEELIYTWLTRAKENLIIINIENEKYDKFFKKYK